MGSPLTVVDALELTVAILVDAVVVVTADDEITDLCGTLKDTGRYDTVRGAPETSIKTIFQHLIQIIISE